MPVQISQEEKLQFSELHYRRLFETAQDGILILDAETGKISDANPYLKKILGYSHSELLGKELWQIGVFKDIVGSKNAFRQLQETGYIRYNDLPLKTKSGRSIDVEFVSNVYLVDHEKVIQCNIRDITDRKVAQETANLKTKELENMSKSSDATRKALLNVMEDLETAKNLIEVAKAKDEAILASIGEGLIAVDNDRKVIIMNKVAEKMLGYKLESMIGRDVTVLPLEDEGGNLLAVDKRPTYISLVKGRSVSGVYFFVKKDKTKFPIAINVTPIKLAGKIVGALDLFRDITQEQQIDKAKSEFVSLASHQLRTPLGIIKWYLEALMEDDYFKKAPNATQKYFEEIYKSNERLLSLVRDLLSVSRIDQGKVKNTPKLVDPVVLINQIVEQMQILAFKKKVHLVLAIKSTNIPSINIDPLRFHEVMDNLIANAIEYTDAKGEVNIIVNKTKGAFLIKIIDTGIGISEQE